jgi:hypothetical protein
MQEEWKTRVKMIGRKETKKEWNNCVPVTSARRVLWLRLARLQVWKVAANILNKETQTAVKWWFSSLRVGWGTVDFSSSTLRNVAQGLGFRRNFYIGAALLNTVMNRRSRKWQGTFWLIEQPSSVFYSFIWVLYTEDCVGLTPGFCGP